MKRGDHIFVWRRGGYQHHGIYAGKYRVIHYGNKLGKSKKNAVICYTRLENFAQGRMVQTFDYGDQRPFDHAETILRARSKLGEGDYDLFGRNCEHFASWCVTGQGTSDQIDAAVRGVTASGSVTGIAAPFTGLVPVAGLAAAVGYGLFRASLRWRS